MDRISKLFSIIFKYILYFSIFFLWVYYYNKDLVISCIISILLSILLDLVTCIFIKKKNNNAKLKNNEKKQIELFSKQFLFSTQFQNINYFCNLFNNPNTKKFKGYFTINNTTFLPYYVKAELCDEDVLYLYKSVNIKTKNFVVLCKDISNSAILLSKSIENYNFVILNENDVYLKFLKPLNAIPPKNISFKENKKLRKMELLQMAFNKKNTKGYFLSGLIILISSIFIRYKIYYISFASLLFIFSYFSHFNVWFNKETKNDFME